MFNYARSATDTMCQLFDKFQMSLTISIYEYEITEIHIKMLMPIITYDILSVVICFASYGRMITKGHTTVKKVKENGTLYIHNMFNFEC